MTKQLVGYAARVAARIHNASADMDPDIMQLPGGTVIAAVIWLYTLGAVVFRRRRLRSVHAAPPASEDSQRSARSEGRSQFRARPQICRR